VNIKVSCSFTEPLVEAGSSSHLQMRTATNAIGQRSKRAVTTNGSSQILSACVAPTGGLKHELGT